MAEHTHAHYCACGCGGLSKEKWLPGHDQRLRAAIENEVGGLVELRRIIEELLHRSIELNHNQKDRRVYTQTLKRSAEMNTVTYTGEQHETHDRNRAA